MHPHVMDQRLWRNYRHGSSASALLPGLRWLDALAELLGVYVCFVVKSLAIFRYRE